MLLKERSSGHLVEVLSLNDLFNLYRDQIVGRYQFGEEMPDPSLFKKSELIFLSGEELPQCWVDPHYRGKELRLVGNQN